MNALVSQRATLERLQCPSPSALTGSGRELGHLQGSYRPGCRVGGWGRRAMSWAHPALCAQGCGLSGTRPPSSRGGGAGCLEAALWDGACVKTVQSLESICRVATGSPNMGGPSVQGPLPSSCFHPNHGLPLHQRNPDQPRLEPLALLHLPALADPQRRPPCPPP